MIESPAGMRNAAEMPVAARARMSTQPSDANPPSPENTRKTAMARMKTRRRP
jgi:hypothetical protein